MKHILRALVLTFLLVGLAACGSEAEPAADSSDASSTSEDSVTSTTEEAHDDEDGDDHMDDKDDDHDDDNHKDDDDHDDDKSGLSAHEHGVAELTVAWTEGDMVIDLISPTYNIFGFENEAATEEEKTVVEDSTKALNAPGVIAINTEAGCELEGEPTTELEYEGSHAEITASWTLTCANPDDISELDATKLFEEFTNLEDVDVQWASQAGQSSAELTPDSTSLALS